VFEAVERLLPGWLKTIPKGTQPPRLSERHADVIALVSRSDALKDDVPADGWSDVDVD
jgi:hypothetical protein